MQKTKQTSIVLNAMAFAAMLLFASQAADAASTQSPSVDAPTTANAQTPANTQDTPAAADDTSPDTAGTHQVDEADVIGDIGNQDVEIPDVTEVEVPDSE